MGLFRRRADRGEGSARRREPTEPAPVSEEAEPEPAPFVAPRESSPSPGDWMAMPPMARTVGPAPSRISNLQRISDMMTTRRPLALTGTLGHRVSPLAPAGSVDGLATAVDRPHEVDGGGGDLTLRAPVVQHDEPVAPEPPIVQREVSVTASTTQSLPAITAARLPQPPPARALHEPLSLPGRDVGAENPPRPLAVVQRQAAAPAPASSAASAPSLTSGASEVTTSTSAPTPDPAAPAELESEPEAERDAPVGAPLHPVSSMQQPAAAGGGDTDTASAAPAGEGTVVDLPLAATAPPAAGTSPIPMEDVMPPIQPRAIQRRAAEAAGASARPETAADAPLPPLPDWARPAQPVRDDAPAASPSSLASPASPSMPLQHPTVQRETAPGHHEHDGHDHSRDEPHGDALDHAQEDAPALTPVSREAIPGAAATASSPAPNASSGDEEEHAMHAPLAGDAAPIAAMPDALDASTIAEIADVTEDAPAVDLPLHTGAAGGPASSPEPPDEVPGVPTGNRWNAPSERLPSDRVPDAPPGDDEPAIQRMADGTASTDTTSSTVPLLGDRPLPLHAAPRSRWGRVAART